LVVVTGFELVGAPGKEVVKTGGVLYTGVVAGVSDLQPENGTGARTMPKATIAVKILFINNSLKYNILTGHYTLSILIKLDRSPL
jgi:hypothetical protein